MAKKEKNRITFFNMVTFFMALAAFLMSGTALLLSYDNGRIVKNGRIVMEEIRQTLENRGEDDAGEDSGSSGEFDQESEKALFRIRENLEKIRLRLKESGDLGAAFEKMKEIRADLVEYSGKWGSRSRPLWNDLKREFDETLALLRQKAAEAGPQLESLSDNLDFLLGSGEEESPPENN